MIYQKDSLFVRFYRLRPANLTLWSISNNINCQKDIGGNLVQNMRHFVSFI